MTNPPSQQPEGDNSPPPEGDTSPPPEGSYPPSQGGFGAPPPQGGFGAPPPEGDNSPPPEGSYPPPQGGFGAPPQGSYPPPPQGNYPPPQGNYPPPQGGYGPPPQGSYPPPPQGNYPPPQGGYGAPPQGGYLPPSGTYGAPQGYPPAGGLGFGASPEVNIGEGVSWAWNKFSKNAVALIVPTLVYAVVLGAIYGIITLLAGALAPVSTSSYQSSDGGFSYSYGAGLGIASVIVMLLGYLVLFIAGGAISSAYYGALLDIANGQPVTIGSFFKPRNVGSVLISSLLVGIAVSIGSLLCLLPGLVVAIFTMFATLFIIERNFSPVDGIKASIEIVKKSFVQVLLTWLISGIIIAVGVLLCGIGLLVAGPVASLFLVFAYRRLTGGQIAPLTP